MDPVSAAAVAILAPYLAKAGEAFASKVGEAAFDGAKSLLKTIREKFARDDDDYAKQTLQRLEELPADAGRQQALESVLKEKADADSGFADELKQLVADTTKGQPVGNFLVEVYGGQVKNIVQVQTTETLNVN
jgi:hypothetical protein